MASYIAFVNSRRDCEFLKGTYSDAFLARISLTASEDVWTSLPKTVGRWVDPGVDIFHDWPPRSSEERDRFATFDKDGAFADATFLEKPERKTVESFVGRILAASSKLEPKWISVPQMPYDREKKRTTVNRHLAKATAVWAKESGFGGKLIVPVILVHQEQVNSKVERDRIIRIATTRVAEAGADGVWLVDSSLDDQSGSSRNAEKRFPGLVEFHGDLVAALPKKAIVVVGPYWGMNLVLWARGLATYPAIGLGGSYQYHIPGGMRRRPASRVAISPLRRQAKVNPALESWLDEAADSFPKGSGTRKAFESLKRNLGPLQDLENARRQVATFYKSWLDKLEGVPEGGRALAFYQDLSDAYVTGKRIKAGLSHERAARRPERIAQQLMLSSL